jgi:hypothetical protein
VFRTN